MEDTLKSELQAELNRDVHPWQYMLTVFMSPAITSASADDAVATAWETLLFNLFADCDWLGKKKTVSGLEPALLPFGQSAPSEVLIPQVECHLRSISVALGGKDLTLEQLIEMLCSSAPGSEVRDINDENGGRFLDSNALFRGLALNTLTQEVKANIMIDLQDLLSSLLRRAITLQVFHAKNSPLLLIDHKKLASRLKVSPSLYAVAAASLCLVPVEQDFDVTKLPPGSLYYKVGRSSFNIRKVTIGRDRVVFIFGTKHRVDTTLPSFFRRSTTLLKFIVRKSDDKQIKKTDL